MGLALIGVHFGRARTALLEEQLDGLERIAAGFEPPLVVVGDFNAAPWTRLVGEAAARTGTRPVGGFRVTWEGDYPVVGLPSVVGHQIDHVLLSPGIGLSLIETLPIPGSDHHGLLIELVVPDAGSALSPGNAADYLRTATR